MLRTALGMVARSSGPGRFDGATNPECAGSKTNLRDGGQCRDGRIVPAFRPQQQKNAADWPTRFIEGRRAQEGRDG